MVLVGTRLLPRLMQVIAVRQSRELFLLAITAIGLGVGYATYLFGLSFAFGAFVAGLVLSESDYAHQALSDIIPLRDVFGMLFFASVGMLIDPRLLLATAGQVLVSLTTLLVGKSLIVGGLAYAFGYRNVVPLAVGLGLVADRRVRLRARPGGCHERRADQGGVRTHAQHGGGQHGAHAGRFRAHHARSTPGGGDGQDGSRSRPSTSPPPASTTTWSSSAAAGSAASPRSSCSA